jgi:hypothetical protein
LALLLPVPLLGVAALGLALAQALAERGTTALSALVVGLTAGLIVVALTFVVAWRRGPLFVRDRAEIAKRRRRNKQHVQIVAWIAVPIGVVAAAVPGVGQIGLLAFCAGFLVASGAWILAHFALHHAEIERLSNGSL